MAKKAVKTIADATRCAVKVSEGKACTQAELKATVAILYAALKTARATAKAAKNQAKESKDMVSKLLSRIGL